MPNYVYNKLIIDTDENFKKVAEFLEGENGIVDFNSIIPTPAWVYQGELGLEEEAKYPGDLNWYNWNIKNWDTKWNAIDSELIPEEKTIEFDTAWSPVINLMTKLGVVFPDVTIEYWYIEEEPAFGGKILIRGTDITTEKDLWWHDDYQELVEFEAEFNGTFPEKIGYVWKNEGWEYDCDRAT